MASGQCLSARSTLCRKKFPPLNSLQFCQIVTNFQNVCTAGNRMKFATKSIRHYPSHLRHVATVPREISNSKVSAKLQRVKWWELI